MGGGGEPVTFFSKMWLPLILFVANLHIDQEEKG